MRGSRSHKRVQVPLKSGPPISKILRKDIKSGSGHLAPTESIEAVLGVTPSGQIMAHGVGGIAGIAVSKKIHAKRASADGPSVENGLAQELPANNVYLAALSNGDLVFFDKSVMSGRVTGLAARVPRNDLASYTMKTAALIGKVTLRFTDGSVYHADVPMGMGLNDFAGVLQRHGGAAEMVSRQP